MGNRSTCRFGRIGESLFTHRRGQVATLQDRKERELPAVGSVMYCRADAGFKRGWPESARPPGVSSVIWMGQFACFSRHAVSCLFSTVPF